MKISVNSQKESTISRVLSLIRGDRNSIVYCSFELDCVYFPCNENNKKNSKLLRRLSKQVNRKSFANTEALQKKEVNGDCENFLGNGDCKKRDSRLAKL